VFTLSLQTVRGFELDGGGGKVEPTDHATQKYIALLESQYLIQNTPINEAEVRATFLHINFGHERKEPVKQCRGELFEATGLGVIVTTCLDDGHTLLPSLDEFRNELGRVLQVAIHAHHGLTPGAGQSSQQGSLMSETAG